MPALRNKRRSGRQNIARANAVRHRYVRNSVPDPEGNTVTESATLIPTESVEEVEGDGGDELGATQEEAEHPLD
jgi:phosphoribosylformylglycinamidine (FGAM) synthase PurS component